MLHVCGCVCIISIAQVSRSLTPVLVMLISIAYFGKTFSTERKVSVVPIVCGAAMALYGEMSYTLIGAAYTFLCVVLAALKPVVSAELLTGELKLHPVDLLLKVCPLALIEIGMISVLTGEVSEIAANWRPLLSSAAPQVVLFSGLLAFMLNVSSFIANKTTSALTLCICANMKQVCLAYVRLCVCGNAQCSKCCY